MAVTWLSYWSEGSERDFVLTFAIIPAEFRDTCCVGIIFYDDALIAKVWFEDGRAVWIQFCDEIMLFCQLGLQFGLLV